MPRIRVGRQFASLLVALALAILAGCRAAYRPDPQLDNHQAHLDLLEKRLLSKPDPGATYADYVELGIARYQLWKQYVGRTRGREAKHLKSGAIAAFERAAEQSADPVAAARAKMRLSWVYRDMSDWDKEIAMLKRILKEHGDLDAPAAFGLGRTPQYYCYYTLAGLYQRKGERAHAIDALARALMASTTLERDMTKPTGLDYTALLLGRLLEYEPRIVLPSYQLLLPPGARKMIDAYRAKVQTRVRLTVERADHEGVTVRYEVVFPTYPAILKAWEEEQERERKNPRVYLPDEELFRFNPVYHLSLQGLPVTAGFELPDGEPPGLVPEQYTPELTFDKNTTATGKLRLKWSDKAGPQKDVYLTAKLVRQGGWYWPSALPAEQVYVMPIRITVKAP